MPFPALWAPAIYCYSAMAGTLLVIWICTSPRVDIPYRYLASLAIVTTYNANSLLGEATSLQWFTPFGALALLFASASNRRLILFAESLFTLIAGLSGPFSIFLTPFYALVAWRQNREKSAEFEPSNTARFYHDVLWARANRLHRSVSQYILVSSGGERRRKRFYFTIGHCRLDKRLL